MSPQQNSIDLGCVEISFRKISQAFWIILFCNITFSIVLAFPGGLLYCTKAKPESGLLYYFSTISKADQHKTIFIKIKKTQHSLRMAQTLICIRKVLFLICCSRHFDNPLQGCRRNINQIRRDCPDIRNRGILGTEMYPGLFVLLS